MDPDRANLSGITNKDVATSAAAGLRWAELTMYIEGDKNIPVVARLQIDERAQLPDLNSLYTEKSSPGRPVRVLRPALPFFSASCS